MQVSRPDARAVEQAVVTRAQRLLDEMADQGDEALGAALIDLLAGRAGHDTARLPACGGR